MAEKIKPKCRISKGESVRSPEGIKFDDKWLNVEGDNLEEVKKIFNEEWDKK